MKANPNALAWVYVGLHFPEALDLLPGHSSCVILSFEFWNVTGELLRLLD